MTERRDGAERILGFAAARRPGRSIRRKAAPGRKQARRPDMPAEAMRIRFFSLFSGIGGFDLGLCRAGHSCVGACENDPYKRRVYELHFPGVRLWDDARTIDPRSLPNFEVLCGGFPCQSFSLAGRRRGLADPRGDICFEIHRIAACARPPYLLLENVPGLLSHENGKTFRAIIEPLDEMGYDVSWQSINGKHFLPQNRERIFIVCALRGTGARPVLPLGGRGGEDIPEGRGEEAAPDGRGREDTVSTLTAQYNKRQNSGESYVDASLNGKAGSARGGYRAYTPEGLARALRPSGGGTGPCAARRSSPSSNDRMVKNPGEPSHSITTEDTACVTDGVKIRRLTPVECERLQGFPDGWTSILSDARRYRSLGDAVMVPVAEYLGRRLSVGE